VVWVLGGGGVFPGGRARPGVFWSGVVGLAVSDSGAFFEDVVVEGVA